MALKDDPAVLALIEKCSAKEAKDERKRVLGVLKQAKSTATAAIEDAAARKVAKDLLREVEAAVKA